MATTRTSYTYATGSAVSGNRASEVIFSPSSLSTISNTITVEQEPVKVEGFNFLPGQEVAIQMCTGEGSGTNFAPFTPVPNFPIVLSADFNSVVLHWPGRYRFVLSGGFGCTVVVSKFSMSHEWGNYYSSIAEAANSGSGLVQSIAVMDSNTIDFTISPNGPHGPSTGAVTITGDIKLVIDPDQVIQPTPNGFIVQQATNQEIEDAIPDLLVVTADNLAHVVNAKGNATRYTKCGVDAGSGSGTGQTSIGFRAGQNAVTPLQTGTYVGSLAGQNDSGTVGSTCIGLSAGTNNSGPNSTLIGTNAGTNNSGSTCTFVGVSAGAQNTTSSTIGIGFIAGQTNTGSGGLFLGNGAGNANSGDVLIALGASAGISNTGANVTAIGNSCAGRNAGDFSIIAGQFSGYDNLADGVVALGVQSATAYNIMGFGSGPTCLGVNSGKAALGLSHTNIGANSGIFASNNGVTTLGQGAYSQPASPTTDFDWNPTLATRNIVTTVPHGRPLGVRVSAFFSLIDGGDVFPVGFDGGPWVLTPLDAVTLRIEGTPLGFSDVGTGAPFRVSFINPADQFSNVSVIGSGAQPTANNQVMLGNTSTTIVNSSGAFVTVSDGTFKTDVVDIPLALDKVAAIGGVTYFWDEVAINDAAFDLLETQYPDEDFSHNDKTRLSEEHLIRYKANRIIGEEHLSVKKYGVIAQDVELQEEGLVSTDNRGYKQINKDGLLYLALAALKEAKDEIDTINARLLAASIP